MNPPGPYSPRSSIVSTAFALRHMILEEIKHRRGALHGEPSTDPSAQRADNDALILLARSLRVEKADDHFRLVVDSGDRLHELRVGSHEAALYWRGLTPEEARARLGSSCDTPHSTRDPVLEHNRQLAASIVDDLLEQMRPDG
jgi:hypothetical protein